MKVNVSFNVESVEINPDADSFKTPAVAFNMEIECEKEEYLALLPHLLEVRKELLKFWAQFGGGVKSLLDQWLPKMWEYFLWKESFPSQVPEEVPASEDYPPTRRDGHSMFGLRS